MTNEDLWVKYWKTRDQDIRQQLIISYLWLVKQLAGRLVVKLPAYFSREDLENSGILGLIEAVDKFNPEKGCSFETYAYNRVRGAMIDSLRKLNWVPRTLWSKLQKVNAARGKLEKEKGGTITDQQLAGEMGISIEELHNVCAHFSRVTIASLDEVLISSEGEQMHLRGFIEDPTIPDPLDIIEIKENKKKLIQAIEYLPEKDRLILALYYQEGLTLKEIGKVLEVSESRVCQLHSRAIRRLRSILKEMSYERVG